MTKKTKYKTVKETELAGLRKFSDRGHKPSF